MPSFEHVPPSKTVLLWAVVAGLACNGGPNDETSASGSTVETSTGVGSTSTGADDSTSTDTSTGPGARCGDGTLDPDEQCDDGNPLNGDGCNLDCTPSAALRWEYRSQTANQDAFTGVAVGPDARIYAAGYRITANQDRWLSHFTATGELEWSRTYDKTTFEILKAVVADDAGIHVAGATEVDDVHRLWVGRLDLDGELIWEDEFASAFGDAYASGLASVSNLEAIVVGLSTLEDGSAEIWLRRYGSTGTVKWTESRAIGLGTEYAVGPDVSADQEAVVVGFQASPAGELLLAYPIEGGAPLLDLTPTMPLSGISAVAWTRDGDITIAAFGQQNGQMQVRRLDPAGATRWSSTDCTADIAESLAVDGAGDIVALGSGPAAGGRNIRLCKFSPDGALRWGKDIDGGQGDDEGLALAILPDDGIVAAGSMYSGAQLFNAWLAVYAP